MGMGFAPTWLRQVTPLLHKTTLTTVGGCVLGVSHANAYCTNAKCGFQR